MSDWSVITEALSNMTLDTKENWNVLKKMFKSLSKKYSENDYLFVLTNEVYDQNDCFLAIKTILEHSIDPNIKGDFGYNFIQNALDAGYEELFIIQIMDAAFRCNLDANHQDENGETMLHTAIYNDCYKGQLLNICHLMLANGFDANLKDNFGKTVVEAMQDEKERAGKYKDQQIDEIIYMCDGNRMIDYRQISEYIDKLLSKMSGDYDKNAQLLFTQLGALGYDESKCLFGLTGQKVDESLNSIAVYSLLDSCKCDPNKVDQFGNNFIQIAIYTGYSQRFIEDTIEEAIINLNLIDKNMKLNINHQNEDGETMLHTAIYSDDYKGDIASFLNFLDKFNFDYNLRDKRGKNIVEAMRYMKYKYSDKDVEKVEDFFKKKALYKSQNENLSCLNVVSEMLKRMTGNLKVDRDIIVETLKQNSLNLDYLFYVLGEHFDEGTNYYNAMRAILDIGVDVNYTVFRGQNVFLQNIIERGFSESFIFWFINQNKSKINFNYSNTKKETILHSAIKSDKYTGSLCALYELLIESGFESSVLDIQDRKIMDVLLYEQNKSKRFSKTQIERFKEIYDSQTMVASSRDENNQSKDLKVLEKRNLNEREIEELSKFGVVMNLKKYKNKPTIGREREIKNLMVTLAQEKKNPILVGESGVGKTAIVDELAYMIQNDNVPKFLKGKIVLEVNPGNLVAGSKYRGSFEEKMKELLNVCQKYDLVLFIDEIHTIYGVGEAEGNSNDMAAMLKHMIDRGGVKVIGTTTNEEYQKYFAQDALKRRFEKILVKEPDEDLLYIILNKVIDDYCIRANLSFEDDLIKEKVVEILIYVTGEKHRVYNDKINNPDLAISIIDKAFAFAMMYESENIGANNFIDGIECCDRLYEVSKDNAKKMLRESRGEIKDRKAKILPIDFTKFRR